MTATFWFLRQKKTFTVQKHEILAPLQNETSAVQILIILLPGFCERKKSVQVRVYEKSVIE